MSNDHNIKLMAPSFSAWQPARDLSKQVAVLMSGGVDSSVTAHLLKEAGWDVLGVTMKIPVSCDTGTRGCCGADAAFVCNELGIPHYFADVTEAFEELIIKPFRQSYLRGQTPNPCVDCNTLLKFSLVWDLVEEAFGIRQVATGHYARVIRTESGAYLGMAKDRAKDQSYFLYGIASEKLAGLLLPLGDLTKREVRGVAADLGLTVADKPESMELCFAGEGDYRAALGEGDADRCGEMTDMQGNKIGTHEGIANYTLGQRRGIGFAGGKPLYVGRIDATGNTIALGTRDEVSFRRIETGRANILIPGEFSAGTSVFGKIRSGGEPKACKLIEASDSGMTVEFDEAQFAPCPGQKLVLYNSDGNIIAGGTICLP